MFYLVKVLIGRQALSLDRLFDYYSFEELRPGMRVLVPFGNSKETIAFIMEVKEIDEELIEYEKINDIKLLKVIKTIDSQPLLDSSLLDLAKDISKYYQCDLIKVINTFLPPALKNKSSSLNKQMAQYKDYVFALEKDEEELNTNEKRLYKKLLNYKTGLKKSEITANKSLKNLVDKGYAIIKSIKVSHIPEIALKYYPEVTLLPEQEQCVLEVLNGEDKVYLLEGVTGSGKSEIYLELAKRMLEKGKSILLLVPEIVLTDQLANKFYYYFKDTVSLLHSSLSEKRKYEEYERILSGEAKVVIGTRSCIFSPLVNLGLIIIDEEHSSSYKQDNQPYYSAITIALMRKEKQGCKVLLGSASPRIVDKCKAENGIFHPLYLNKRYSANQDKDLLIIDMNDSNNYLPSSSSLISKPLFEEIKRTIEKKEQVMLLLNRRGYAPMYQCRHCYSLATCPNCNIPLNYYKKDNELRCNHCGYHILADNYTCTCQEKDFMTIGYGTQRVYEDIRYLFPQAKIMRIDSDVSGFEKRHEIIESFAESDTDILIGTQIIAKGHDFKNVTLAAVLDADSSLRLPSYLANEETYDLISQFVGRTGRALKKGRVLIQTYCKDNKIIQLASKQDYTSFYKYEIEERKKSQYPPYTILALIIVRSPFKNRCYEVAEDIKNKILEEIKDKRFNLYGPSVPFISHRNGRFYQQLLLKYKVREEGEKVLASLKVLRMMNKDVDILIDVDPETEGI